LSRNDYDGNLVWTTSLSLPSTRAVSDQYGSHFLALSDGSVVRLERDPVYAPTISRELAPLTVLVGTVASQNLVASGSAPQRYFWFHYSTFLSNTVEGSLQLTNVVPAQAGTYWVQVSNFVGSVTSAPVELRVKSVEFYLQMPDLTLQVLTNG